MRQEKITISDLNNNNQRLIMAVMVKKDYPKNFIKKFRKERGMTVKELGAAVGLSGPYITMLENSERRLYWDNLQKIAAALEIQPDQIIYGGDSDMHNKREETMLEVFRQLGRDDQEKIIKMGEIMLPPKEEETANTGEAG